MKLLTYETPFGYRVGSVLDGKVVDLNAAYQLYLQRRKGMGFGEALSRASVILPPSMMSLLRAKDEFLKTAREAIEFAKEIGEQSALTYDLDKLKLKPPVYLPGKIWALGLNYREHQKAFSKSFGVPLEEVRPGGFFKSPQTLIGHGEAVIYPKICDNVNLEVELGVVIGKTCKGVRKEKALNYVVGYTIVHDVNALGSIYREDKIGSVTSIFFLDRSHNFDTFGPMGPFLVTKEEIPDPQDLDIKGRINDRIVEDGNTSDQAWTVAEAVARASAFMTLNPGDVISTGASGGQYAEFHPGDTLEGEIEHIGVLRNPVVAEP